MSSYTENYNYGFNMGEMIGGIKFYINLVKKAADTNITNYEEIIKHYQVSEPMCARLMDYLPIRPELWKPVNDEDWISRKLMIREAIKEENTDTILAVLKACII